VVALPLQPIISFTGAMPDSEPLFEGALGRFAASGATGSERDQ